MDRLLLAALAVLPLAYFWWMFIEGHRVPAWLDRPWFLRFMDVGPQTALAVLTGVALAPGFRRAASAQPPR